MSFDTEVHNPVVHTISVFKPKIPRFFNIPSQCQILQYIIANLNVLNRTMIARLEQDLN